MKKTQFVFLTTVFVLLAALIAAIPIFADNTIYCSDFPVGGITGVVPPGDVNEVNVVPAGNYRHIIVDGNCYLSPFVNVNGQVVEPGNTEWSIIVDPQATIKGRITEKGPGDVRISVGHDEFFKGTVSEKGPGFVWVWVDGLFRGSIEEKDEGGLTIDVFGGPPSGGPGTFTGRAVENDSGDANLRIEDPGTYRGSFKEKGDGECDIQPEQRNIRCR